MSRGPKRTKLATFSLGLEDIAQLKWLADQDDRSISWVAREAIQLGLPLLCKQKGLKPPPSISSQETAPTTTKTKNKKARRKADPLPKLSDLSNPWPELRAEDYEVHMRHPDLQQWQTLERMIAKQLADHPARNILWLGVGTGNGLGHVPPLVEHVYCVDCNPDFLNICRERHGGALPGLELHCLDLNQQSLTGPRVDMIMASLVLEFVDPDAFVRQVSAVHVSETIVSVIIQERRSVHMVSSSGVKAMEVLSGYHREVDRDSLIGDLATVGYRLLHEEVEELPDGKVFRRLDLRRG